LLAALGIALPWLIMLGALSADAGDLATLELRLEVVAQGFEAPVLVTGTEDGSSDLFVVEQRGRVHRLHADGTVAADPVIDISDRVLHHSERGLLGMALHPRFGENGRVFVTYSRRDDGATVVSELSLQSDTPASGERTILVIPQLYTTHKGGMLAFDEDGMLLVGIGDGGSGDDPQRHGLDARSLLGKLLRLDVDEGSPYATPHDNGFAAVPTARAEIHAIGLRNPWRFSVDRLSGDVYIGDVGQSGWEEIDVLPRGQRGASFGWSDMEGPDCLGDRPCDPTAHLAPAIAYRHDEASGHCAVIGGYAYRGAAGRLPSGTYVFGDHCSGVIWAVPVEELVAGTSAPPLEVWGVEPAFGQLTSFGEDDAGEIYALTTEGFVLRVIAQP
jgi:glucose/arabinose dehydrogenase